MNITNEKFNNLLEANRILSSTLELKTLLRRIMELATEMVSAETSSLLLLDEKTGELIFDIALTSNEKKLKEIRLKVGEGIAGWAAKEKKSQIINNPREDSRWANQADAKTDYKTRSLLAVPLLFRDRLVGVVEAINKKEGGFSDDDAQVLEAFAAQASVSIENARYFERLREEKEKIEIVFSEMSDGALFADPAGRKIMANAAAEKLLGKENISRDNVSAIFSEFYSLAPISEMLSGREKMVKLDLYRSSGKSMFLAGALNRIAGSDGSTQGFIFTFRDVTAERKEGNFKRNFLSLVSHKLKTPLVTIIGYTPLLLRDQGLNQFQKKAITSIQHQGSYLANLVDKLLNFTIVESESLSLCKSPQFFGPLIDKSLLHYKNLFEEMAVHLTIADTIKEMPAVSMDSDKIEAVIKNLLENAVKFNKSDNKIIEIKPRRDGARFGLSITDNGPGIPPEEREKIFQKFYQIEEYFTGQVEGAGLGLALVKQIVEAHGGTVGLESAIGNGSTFYFLLPPA